MPLLKCSAGQTRSVTAIEYIADQKKAEIVTVRKLFKDEDYVEPFEKTAALYEIFEIIIKPYRICAPPNI